MSNPFGWRLHIDEHSRPPLHMMGRIMIGKMEEGSSVLDIAGILSGVKMPDEPGSLVRSSVEWIKRVIEGLQELGWAEHFGVDDFVEDAMSHAVQWDKTKTQWPRKVNYTLQRSFP